MNNFLWAVFPYICFTLFFSVPLIRMIFRPYGWTTRASGLFDGRMLGLASLLFHWGILLVLFGHVAGWIGGLSGLGGWVAVFYWTALVGGLATIAGSVLLLWRRFAIPEVRAMSQTEDYIILIFLIAILALGLYQVLVDRIFGLAYTAAPWFASIWAFSPQPELMASSSLVTKLHIFLALLFFAYFPFTKMVHFWALPINYFVRPYQSMRTARYWAQRKWEFSLRSDRSYLLYASSLVAVIAIAIAAAPIDLRQPGVSEDAAGIEAADSDELSSYPLYVSQCARCHGLEGSGDGPGADSPIFAAQPRDLIVGAYRFVSTDNGIASDHDLYRTMVEGLPNAGMPAFDELSDDQLKSLVGVLNDMWRERPASGQAIKVKARPAVTGSTLKLGKEVYTDYCVSCHGETGRGDGEFAEGIVDGNGEAVPVANLARGRLKAGRSTEQVYLRIVTGIPDGENGYLMPPSDSLTDEETWALVHYLETDILPRVDHTSAPQSSINLSER
jgi:nitrate reductase gamma subunit